MENRTGTKQKILAEAKKLFAKRGYAYTSLDVIAMKVSIAKPSLYYHFKSKEQIYVEVIKNNLIMVIEDLRRYSKDSRSKKITLEKIIIDVIEKRLNDETVIRLVDLKIIGMDQGAFAEIRSTLQQMRALVREILKCHGVKHPDLAAEVLINSIHCYVLHSNNNLSAVDPKRYGDYLASLFKNDTATLK